MKTITISLTDKIKHALQFFKATKEYVTFPKKKEEPLLNDQLLNEKVNTGKEKIDLAEFQRKAYCGNFFVGPYVIFNPDLFD